MSKILEKIQTDEGDICSSSSLYTTRDLVVQDVGDFSAKITHFMLMQSKVNCRKIQIHHRVYVYK
jgi:hypothetical protein